MHIYIQLNASVPVKTNRIVPVGFEHPLPDLAFDARNQLLCWTLLEVKSESLV